MLANADLLHALDRLAQAQRSLEQATLSTFLEFESHHANIAQALLNWTGDRHKAARWLMFQRRAFQGKCGYELAIEGDVDKLWEHICAVSIPRAELHQAY